MYENRDFNSIGSVKRPRGSFAVGALIGAGLALLLTPKAGPEMRRRLGATAKKIGQGARQRFGKGRNAVEGIKSDARSAIDAGRQAYESTRPVATGKPVAH